MDDFDDVDLKAELDDITETIDAIIKKVEAYETKINDESEEKD